MGNANLRLPLTQGQSKGLVIAREISATPSLIGSIYIMQDVLRSPGRRCTTGPRILFGMSFMDFLFAIYSLANSWPAPKGTPWTPAAIGTWRSCEAFGLIGQASKTSSALYNGSLALYYLLTIRYNWRESKMKRLEPWLHAIPLLFGWITALVALLLDLYNPMPVGCNLRPYPLKCGEGFGIPCQRGENAYLYQVAFFYGPLWACFFFLVATMSIIYRKMSQLQAANELYQPESRLSSNIGVDGVRVPPPSIHRALPSRASVRCLFGGGCSSSRGSIINNNSSTRSNMRNNSAKQQFATQALLYCAAYGMAWCFGMAQFVVRVVSPTTNETIPLIFLNTIMSALQGFFNAFIYIRPRYKRSREDQI